MLRVVEVGLACWLVALVVMLVVPALHEGDRDWWPWTCVAGLRPRLRWAGPTCAAGAATPATPPERRGRPRRAGMPSRRLAYDCRPGPSVGDGVVRPVLLLGLAWAGCSVGTWPPRGCSSSGAASATSAPTSASAAVVGGRLGVGHLDGLEVDGELVDDRLADRQRARAGRRRSRSAHRSRGRARRPARRTGSTRWRRRRRWRAGRRPSAGSSRTSSSAPSPWPTVGGRDRRRRRTTGWRRPRGPRRTARADGRGRARRSAIWSTSSSPVASKPASR